jgi:hypothetical protein
MTGNCAKSIDKIQRGIASIDAKENPDTSWIPPNLRVVTVIKPEPLQVFVPRVSFWQQRCNPRYELRLFIAV